MTPSVMLSNNDILPNFSATFDIFHINVPSWETCRMSSIVCRIDVISWERISWVGWSPCMDALCSSTLALIAVKPLSKPLTCVVISDECWFRRWASPLSASIPKARTSTVSDTSCKCSTVVSLRDLGLTVVICGRVSISIPDSLSRESIGTAKARRWTKAIRALWCSKLLKCSDIWMRIT